MEVLVERVRHGVARLRRRPGQRRPARPAVSAARPRHRVAPGVGRALGPPAVRLPAGLAEDRIPRGPAVRGDRKARVGDPGASPPAPEWADFSGRRDREVAAREVRSGSAGPDDASIRAGNDAVPGEPIRFLRLDGGLGRDPFPEAVGWQSLLRRDDGSAPNAVFFGGTISRAYLGVFRKALATPDFVRIWNVTAGEEGTMGRGAN